MLSYIGMIFMGSFIYYTSYRSKLKLYRNEFFKRVLVTYFLAVLVVGILSTVVDKCPWFSALEVALKRILIGAFPASLSATVTDNFGS
jgi:uncharacterized membrane protein